MLNQVQVQVMMADNTQTLDMAEAIIAINHVHQQTNQLVIVIAYTATISPVTTTSGTVITNPNTHIRDVAVTFHNTIKSNVAVMCHSTIVNNAVAKFLNTIIPVNANIAQNTLVKNVVNMFHSITTSILVNHSVSPIARHNALHNARHNAVMAATEAKQSFNCVSYFQMGRNFLPV